MNKNYPEPEWSESVVRRKRKYSSDPHEHAYIRRVDLHNNYSDEWIELPETDPLLALDTLFYEIKDFLEGEYSQDIMEERNIYLYHNYQLVKQALEKKF